MGRRGLGIGAGGWATGEEKTAQPALLSMQVSDSHGERLLHWIVGILCAYLLFCSRREGHRPASSIVTRVLTADLLHSILYVATIFLPIVTVLYGGFALAQ